MYIIYMFTHGLSNSFIIIIIVCVLKAHFGTMEVCSVITNLFFVCSCVRSVEVGRPRLEQRSTK